MEGPSKYTWIRRRLGRGGAINNSPSLDLIKPVVSWTDSAYCLGCLTAITPRVDSCSILTESTMMKGFLRSVLGLATLASAISSQYADDLRSRRAVSDQCTAPEGTGSCQHTSDCPGISYPTGLCPNDPTDVQVRLCELLLWSFSPDFPRHSAAWR